MADNVIAHHGAKNASEIGSYAQLDIVHVAAPVTGNLQDNFVLMDTYVLRRKLFHLE